MNLTAEQIAKVATNYALLNSNDLQVLKITKTTTNEYSTVIANVRVINSVGKKFTTVVYLYPDRDTLSADIDVFCTSNRPSISELLQMNMDNPIFGSLEEEKEKIEAAKKEQAEKQALIDFKHKMYSLKNEYEYYRKRSQLGLYQRSLKKEGIQKLESYLPYQEGYVKANIEQAIKALQAAEVEAGKKIEYNPGKRTVFYNPEIEMVITMVEDSFTQYEENVYKAALESLQQKGEQNTLRTVEQQAQDYVDNQKSRLMCAIIRDLYDLKIIKVETESIRNEPNGFEGFWKLTLADNKIKYYNTRSIIAGGYIQRLHYRYITKLN